MTMLVRVYKDGTFISEAVQTKPQAAIFCFTFTTVISSIKLEDTFDVVYPDGTFAIYLANNFTREDGMKTIWAELYIPNSGRFYFAECNDRGLEYLNSDKTMAERYFDTAINLNSNCAKCYGNKGILRLYQERFDDAYKLFKKSVKLDDNLKKDIAEDKDIILWLCDDENKDKAQEVRDEINKIIAPERLKECPKQQK